MPSSMGAWFMASRHPDLFSAVIPMAGPPVLSPVTDARAGLAAAERFLGGDEIEWSAALVEMPIFAVHSRADELVDVDLVSRAVNSLRAAGGRVKLLKAPDLGHFETPRYVEYLRRAVPWLRRVWER